MSNGSRAVMPCSVTGVPPPNVIWTVVSSSVGGEGISFMCSNNVSVISHDVYVELFIK